jgi:hypothetical protein
MPAQQLPSQFFSVLGDAFLLELRMQRNRIVFDTDIQ